MRCGRRIADGHAVTPKGLPAINEQATQRTLCHCFPISLRARSLKLRIDSFCLRPLAFALILIVAGCSSANGPSQNVTDDTRMRLAKALMAAGDPASAAEAMRTPEARANAQAPDDLMNAQLLIAAGKVDAGMEVAETALAVRGDDPNFALDVAGLAVRSNRLPEADKIYRGILRLHPANVEAMNGEAVVLAQEGNLADAETLLRQALARSPEDVPARNNLALVQLLSRQREEKIAAPQELGPSTPPPPVEPARTPAVVPNAVPRPIASATPAVTSPAILVEPSAGTQTAPSASTRAPLPRVDASSPWSCPGICQLMHSVLDRGTAGQAQQ
jgi:Flp pilus assembly protein TadD